MSEGLAITLNWDGQRVSQARIALRRPQAARLLVGQPAAQAVSILPRLYRLCTKAQGVAARLALAAAGLADEAPQPDLAERRALLAEQIQEHLWRLLYDWPALLGVTVPEAEFVQWHRRLATLPTDAAGCRQLAEQLLAFTEEEVGARFSPWLLIRLQALSGQQALAVAALPSALRAADFAAPWPADFAEQPHWQGRPAATGHHGSDLPQSLLQRLSALSSAARQLAAALRSDAENGCPALADSTALPDNGGLARVVTARGTLLHRLQLDGQGSAARIAAYQVVAPTEWNFHPQGPCAVALAGLQAGSEALLRRLAGCWITAFDPCVGWQLNIVKD